MNPIYIGVPGAVLILIAFYMSETERWSDKNVYYQIINLIGSLTLAVYAYILGSPPFLILNGIWAIISFRDLIIDFKINK